MIKFANKPQGEINFTPFKLSGVRMLIACPECRHRARMPFRWDWILDQRINEKVEYSCVCVRCMHCWSEEIELRFVIKSSKKM